MLKSQSSTVNRIESLPIDLIANIFSNLPAKYVGKFRCVSKLWASTLSQSYFTDLFLTISSSRPRLLFDLSHHVQGGPRKRCCLSSPQPQNPDENTSIAVDSRIGLGLRCAVSGMIFCLRSDNKSDNILALQIGNPTTGQYVDLPMLINKRRFSWEFFGYDPIGREYKILSMNELAARFHLLTFPCQNNQSWRPIQCPTRHRPFSSGICINGILYYVARKEDGFYVIVCFNVRSEEFKFIEEPESRFLGRAKRSRLFVCLSNVNGKLVLICYPSTGYLGRTKLELCVWVLEDDKKPEWSKHVYPLTLPYDFFGGVDGMIGTGEILLSECIQRSGPFYVFYFNLEKNTLKKVEIQGIEADKDNVVTIHLNHVENVSFIA